MLGLISHRQNISKTHINKTSLGEILSNFFKCKGVLPQKSLIIAQTIWMPDFSISRQS